MINNPNGSTPESGPADTSGFLSIEQAVEQYSQQSQEPEQAVVETPEPEASVEPEQAPDQEPVVEAEAEAQVEEPQADEEAVDQPDPAPEPAVLFEHEGEQITLEEAQKGYLRNADYTRKRQEDAEKARQLEAESKSLDAERQQYASNLSYLQNQLSALGSMGDNTDWATLEVEDPVGYLKARDDQRAVRENLAAVNAEQQRVANAEQARIKSEQDAWVASQQTRLFEVLPDWKAPEKAAVERTKIGTYLKSRGITQAEIDAIADSRLIHIFSDAANGSALTSKDSLGAKKIAKAKPAMKNAGHAQAQAATASVKSAQAAFDKDPTVDNATALQIARQGLT